MSAVPLDDLFTLNVCILWHTISYSHFSNMCAIYTCVHYLASSPFATLQICQKGPSVPGNKVLITLTDRHSFTLINTSRHILYFGMMWEYEWSRYMSMSDPGLARDVHGRAWSPCVTDHSCNHACSTKWMDIQDISTNLTLENPPFLHIYIRHGLICWTSLFTSGVAVFPWAVGWVCMSCWLVLLSFHCISIIILHHWL